MLGAERRSARPEATGGRDGGRSEAQLGARHAEGFGHVRETRQQTNRHSAVDRALAVGRYAGGGAVNSGTPVEFSPLRCRRMSIPWADIGTVSTAGLSAIATWGAWLAARRSAKTASTVARIEQDRWHAELLPQFQVSVDRAEGDRATLSVRLVGPLPLCHLDEIRIEVAQSDDMARIAGLAGGPSQEELDAQVWGPLRFTHGADGADINGKTVAPFALEVGKGRPFSMERTRPPHWQEGNDRDARWRDQWLNTPMRLVLTCKRDGFKNWVVPFEVEVPQSPRMRWLN